jgi:hypothetical protein
MIFLDGLGSQLALLEMVQNMNLSVDLASRSYVYSIVHFSDRQFFLSYN